MEPECIFGREHEYEFHPNARGADIAICRFCYYAPQKPPRRKTSQRRPRSLRGAAQLLRAQMKDQCVYCGVSLDDATRTVDHVVPRSRGGKDHLSNYVLSCLGCNNVKGDRTVHEWLGVYNPPFLVYRKTSFAGVPQCSHHDI